MSSLPGEYTFSVANAEKKGLDAIGSDAFLFPDGNVEANFAEYLFVFFP